MRHELSLWERRHAIRRIDATPTFADDFLVLGAGTKLLPIERTVQKRLTLGSDARHDRLVALLAVAGRDRLAADAAVAHIDIALDDWARGDKGLAAIRLAFAPLPRLADEGDAYTLFLAEKALDAGLSPRDLLAELGFGAVAPLLKGAVDQPRVPAGSGRASGRWTGASDAEGSGQSASRGIAAETSRSETPKGTTASITPVFLDTKNDRERDHDDITGDKTSPFLPEFYPRAIIDGHVLDFTVPKVGPSVPLPFLVPSPRPDADDKDGPACPAMRADRRRGPNDAGDREEDRVARLVNPEGPTPKSSPENPDVTSMAYYLSLENGEVAHDDCKRTSEPSPGIPGLRKGDMVEVKTDGAAAMIQIPVLDARQNFDSQFGRLIGSVRRDGKGRHVFFCVGSQTNADNLARVYSRGNPEAHFVVCN